MVGVNPARAQACSVWARQRSLMIHGSVASRTRSTSSSPAKGWLAGRITKVVVEQRDGDQPDAGFGLQPVDVVADRGLGIAQLSGGGGERAVLRHRAQYEKPPNVEHGLIVTRCRPPGRLKTAS